MTPERKQVIYRMAIARLIPRATLFSRCVGLCFAKALRRYVSLPLTSAICRSPHEIAVRLALPGLLRRFLRRFLVSRGIQRHGRAAYCMPSGNPADESPGVKAALSQPGHGRATDLKSANAINRDRPASRQLLDPARQRGRSVHGGTRQHIGASGQIPRQTEIQKYRSAIIVTLKHGLQLLGRNPRLFLRRRAEGEEGLVFSRSFADCHTIPRAYPFPIQVCHHLVDIGSCLRAKIEMIGMLVHVEREDRSSPWKAMRVVCRPLVDQPAQALRPSEDHPT